MTYAPTVKAVKALSKLDPVMAAHIKKHVVCDIAPKVGGPSYFELLAREITFQQLAGAAANTIWKRTRALVKGRFTAPAVLALDPLVMRSAGLSNNKMLSIRDLAQHVVDKKLPFSKMSTMTNEDVSEALTQVRGIGQWTADMFMIFNLYRLDIWPVGDLGVRNGFREIYGLETSPTMKEFAGMGDHLRPYRSIAAWYCWRAVDVVLPDENLAKKP